MYRRGEACGFLPSSIPFPSLSSLFSLSAGMVPNNKYIFGSGLEEDRTKREKKVDMEDVEFAEWSE